MFGRRRVVLGAARPSADRDAVRRALVFAGAIAASGGQSPGVDALNHAHAAGIVLVQDVRSGEILTHAESDAPGSARDVTAGGESVLPLSLVKVFVAAAWLDAGLGDMVLDCDASAAHPVRRMRVDEVMVSGCDSAGMRMAIALRRRLGAGAVLARLRAYGLTELSLRGDAPDDHWGRVLSLGEEDVRVTAIQIASLLRALGRDGDGVLRPATARRLRAALEAVVERGTATSILPAFTGTGWTIGGKTGTGPGQCGSTCDGWFAGLLSQHGRPRYVVLAFVRGRGLGGGVAAQAAAALGRRFIE